MTFQTVKNVLFFSHAIIFKTVFQLKGENQLPNIGLFLALLQGFFLDVVLEKHRREGKKCIIEMFFSWEACESLITLNFLNVGKWEIGSAKQTLRLEGQVEIQVFVEPCNTNVC